MTDALLQKTILFEARTGGYHIYRVPCVLATLRGAVLVTAEARPDQGGDWDGNDMVIRGSADGGLTWEPPRLLVDHRALGDGPASNAVLIGDHLDGAVHLLYCHDYQRVFAARSDNDGASFSTPVEITTALEPFRAEYPWRVIGTGPGHGTQLRNGRLIVPIWMSDGSGTEFGPGKRGHRPSAVSLIYSDDHGRSWRRGEIVCRHGQGAIRNPSETACVELADGRVMFNIRNESAHRRLVSLSPDGVSGWSEPVFHDELLEPICMGSLIRLDWGLGGRPGRILFANPDTLEQTMGCWARDRKRLTVKMSCDDGKTWPVSRVLEMGPSGYSDLAVLADGTIACIYECGAVTAMHDVRSLTLARFNVEWLRQGG